MKRFYVLTRDLHLYLGLFISPFVLLFAISVFFLVHSWIPGVGKQPGSRTVNDPSLPADLGQLKGVDQVKALRPVLDRIGVHGEINFVRRVANSARLVIHVIVPGRETSVDLNLQDRSAVITERNTGMWDALVYLHKSPGPHNAAIRGNWVYVQFWRVLADVTVYLILFISISGIYLWAVLRAERRIGLTLIAASALSFFGLVYVLSH